MYKLRHVMLAVLGFVGGLLQAQAVTIHAGSADAPAAVRSMNWINTTKTKWVWKPDRYLPTIFVSIFSRRTAGSRRLLIRDMWRRADSNLGKMVRFFAICLSDDGLQPSLEEENATYGDLMIMDCKEGYYKGLLTKKTYAAMNVYRKDFAHLDLFMKIDDDTFAAWTRLYPYVADVWKNHSYHMYMGALHPPGAPTRDPLNAFYEPREVYPNDTYPEAADGGPGYILGGELVKKIVDEEIGTHWTLYNEDKAVAVWVDTLMQEGTEVHFKKIEGHTGYARTQEEWDNQLKWFHTGRWIAYPLTLHHRLSGEAVACLSDVERLHDNNATIDHCFTEVDNTWIPTTFRKESEWAGAKLWLSTNRGRI